MAQRVGVGLGIGTLLIAAWLSVACGSSSHPGPGLGPVAGAAGSGGNGSLDFGGAGGKGGDSNGLPDACAADISKAEPIPLDMYVMLDTSSSMLDETAATTTKWDAVKAALEAFLKDDASAGLGVGLQYFPLQKPNAPTSCTNDAQCGDSGPCFLKFCYNLPGNSLFPCEFAADCYDNVNKVDYGPCTLIATCSNNEDYVCATPGAQCQSNDAQNLGTCTPLPSSICEHTASCDATAYATPASPIAALPASAAGLLASIDAKEPAGNTPTAPALGGAIKQASTWAAAHPDHRVITVLATDGLPTECTPTEIGQVGDVAAAGVAATPSISTFVIGVFGPDDVAQGAPDNLNQIAQKGGSQAAFIVDTQKDVTTQFLAALDTIRGARLACEFKIPQPAAGETLDYGRVNVQLTSGTQKSVVYYVKDAAACDPTTGGWHYDVDPTSAVPTKIIACPTSCTAFEAATEGSSVGIALGCQTVVK